MRQVFHYGKWSDDTMIHWQRNTYEAIKTMFMHLDYMYRLINIHNPKVITRLCQAPMLELESSELTKP